VDSGWDPGAAADWMQSDASVDFTTAVLNRPEPPIQESVWRKGTRPVTLFELVGAFEEARKEAELQKVLSEERRKQRLLWESQKAMRVDKMMHREDLQEDINHVWGKIQPLSGRIPLGSLCAGGCDDERLTAFVSILFLAFVKQIRVWQEDFPYGEIFIEKAEEGELPLEKLQNITHPQRKEIWDVKKKKGHLFKKKKGRKGEKAERQEGAKGTDGEKAKKEGKADGGKAPADDSSKEAPAPAPQPAPADNPGKPAREHHKAPSPSPYAAIEPPALPEDLAPPPVNDTPPVPR
jgi:hypothetical protein